MLSRRQYMLVGVVLLATYISAEILTPCEKADDRVADKESCTRYHICRVDPDSADDFLSDIAICPTMMVFDMVSTQCVDVKQGYLQDPAGCNTFYGCRLPSRSSEGYLRTRYRCPGELRFHPQQGFCTHITDVPDTLCNSHIAVQAILGQQESDKPLAEPETPAEDAEGGMQ
ncbi:unnamed protein product [Meganyctiphanes norvegica]|uniref:Chitin-binding type-2 domain-containing protein n=1 Tax=Meganyctiphanes norvegica TaxID=48144 RepID=A0AAV2PTV7_MEGNR